MLDLLFHGARVHVHLDWHEPDDWLDAAEPHMCLSWDGERLMGFLAASGPLDGTSWIRLAALHDHASGQSTLSCLWEDLTGRLGAAGANNVAWLAVNDWIVRYTAGLGFHYLEDVVTLRRTGWQIPPPTAAQVEVRSANPEDLESILPIDHSAFASPWQLSPSDLRQAYRIAANCTVASIDGTIVGYQLSTLFKSSAHLARLAVLPSVQGHGVGSALLDDMIRRFWRRDIYTVTVNTQSGNRRSQRLYHHYGFRRNGYDLAVWKADF